MNAVLLDLRHHSHTNQRYVVFINTVQQGEALCRRAGGTLNSLCILSQILSLKPQLHEFWVVTAPLCSCDLYLLGQESS